jgi:hypothetical protein
MRTPERIVLIDGNNVVRRAHAVWVELVEKRGGPALVNSSGLPIGLIQGTLGMLSDWLPSFRRPTRIVFFKDGTSRRRREIDPGYKFREPKDFGSGSVEYRLSDGHVVNGDLAVIDHVLRLLGVDICYLPDEEADDLIASFIRASDPGTIHFIVSSDKDFYQLVGDNVIQYRPGLEGNRFFDPERVESDFGVAPEHVRMFKSLTGDVTDTYKGVFRIRKKVASLLSKNPNPAAMYSSDLSMCSKLERQRLLDSRSRVETNFILAGMKDDVDLTNAISPGSEDFTTASTVLRGLEITGVDPSSFRTRHGGFSVTSEPPLDFISPDLFSDL